MSPGAPAGRVAWGPLPAAGSASPRWEQAGGRVACGGQEGQGREHLPLGWHCWKGTCVPRPYQHQ